MIRNLTLSLLLLTAAAIFGQGQTECLSCHGQAGKTKSAPVDTAAIAQSVHAGIACSECHHVNADANHAGVTAVYCGQCHQTEADSYAKSPHVEGRTANIEQLPTCVTCHGGHDILAVVNPASRVHGKNSVQICLSCHTDANITDRVTELPKADAIRAYTNSIHGRQLLTMNNENAPACIDCHGSHSFLPSDNPESPIYKTHIAQTCGQCHGDVAKEYQESVHGTALANGVLESPTCTNCHGEHDIRPPADPGSRVFKTAVSQTCSDCHTSDRLVGKYGLKADRIQTFEESFHGAAGALGDVRVANCASCHGVHNIFRQSDPRSTINTANIDKTCGNCHTDLPPSFSQGAVHTSAKVRESGGEFYVRQFYIWFITALILGFIGYRVLEYRRRIRRQSMSGQ